MGPQQFELKSMNSPDEVRKIEKGKIELVKVAGASVGRATFEPGWKWSTCVKPIATDSVVHLSGRDPSGRGVADQTL